MQVYIDLYVLIFKFFERKSEKSKYLTLNDSQRSLTSVCSQFLSEFEHFRPLTENVIILYIF
jgi:hypothetical protein